VFDICAVEVERATGRVRIDRYVTAHDAGRLLNPALADGQIRGGFAQGLGAALYEELVYGEDGAFLSGTFADYLVPTACETPEPLIAHIESPSPFTPLGAKGIGEGNNMSTPVAIANAIADALGVREVRLPLTPQRILDLIDAPEPARPQARQRSSPRARGHACCRRAAAWRYRLHLMRCSPRSSHPGFSRR
jgi:2-furoyl-CoA dehydrogenase large subunit